MRWMRGGFLILLIGVLTACGQVSGTPTVVSSRPSEAPNAATAVQTATSILATATNAPAPTPPPPTATAPPPTVPPPTATTVPPTVPPPAPTKPPPTVPPTAVADPSPLRLDVRRTWTEQVAGRGTFYYFDVAVCNQTQVPRTVYAGGLRVGIASAGSTQAGRGEVPRAQPDGGFTELLPIAPDECKGGVVSVNPRETERPIYIIYKGNKQEYSRSVPVNFP